MFQEMCFSIRCHPAQRSVMASGLVPLCPLLAVYFHLSQEVDGGAASSSVMQHT